MSWLLNELSDIKGGYAMVIVSILLIAVFFFIGKQVRYIFKAMDKEEFKEEE